jgi:hypothetical protein
MYQGNPKMAGKVSPAQDAWCKCIKVIRKWQER